MFCSGGPAEHTAEVMFPNLGMVVESITARKEYLLELPGGNCGPTAGRVGWLHGPALTQAEVAVDNLVAHLRWSMGVHWRQRDY